LTRTTYTLSIAVKLLVSIGLLTWLLKDVQFTAVIETMRQADPLLLALAFSLYFLGYLLTATRWRTLLRAQGHDAPLMSLARSFIVAIFFNNFLPSTIGGDIVRMYDSWKIIRSKAIAMAVVFMDRFFGVFALVTYALLALMFMGEVTQRAPAMQPLLATAFVAAALVIIAVFSRAGRLQRRIEGWQADHPNALLRLLGKGVAAFSAFSGRPGTVIQVYGLSLVLQLNVIVHFIIIARALAIDIPLLPMFLIVPVATVVMMLPVSINGIGVRETIFATLFGFYGIGSESAIAFAWIAYAFVLLQGILGGLIFARRLLAGDRQPAPSTGESHE